MKIKLDGRNKDKKEKRIKRVLQLIMRLFHNSFNFHFKDFDDTSLDDVSM
jgi:hypothetical protein